jgi:hypothetical protein
MNSSISTSEPAAPDAIGAGWSRWLIVFVVGSALGLGALLGVIVLVDPFSTGRLTPLARVDIAIGNRIYSDAGRVRDPQFDAAIFGNSHAVLIHPARLSQATDRHFVTLAINAMDAGDQAYLMTTFDRRHPDQKLVFVVVLDDYWCAEHALKNPAFRLPRWFYDGSTLAYLGHLLSPEALRASFRRLQILAGLASTEGRADGYEGRELAPIFVDGQLKGMTRSPDSADPEAPFPVLHELEQALADLRSDSMVLLAFVPVFSEYTPAASRNGRRLATCKARVRAIAHGRPRTEMVDLRVDLLKVGDPANFIDATHFGAGLARDVEAGIAAGVIALVKGTTARD